MVLIRFIQGFGGALGLPVGRLILVRAFGREQLVPIMSHVVMIGARGLMLGPVIGGLITHYFSWHWIFWVNIPVGLIAIWFASCYLPSVHPSSVPPLDKWGFVLFGSSLAGFSFGLSMLSESKVSILLALGIMLCSVILFLAYTIHSSRSDYPIVNISFQLSLSAFVFHYTFLAMGVFTLTSTLIFLKLDRNDGHQMIAKPSS
jgi:MFS family permease